MSIRDLQDTCFFRYRRVNENTLKEIELGQIWHSRYEFLNDPFEFPFFYDENAFLRSDLDEFFSIHLPLNSHYLEDMREQGLEESVYKQFKYWIQQNMEKVFEYQRNACVACFSGNPYDGLMWSHYAYELKGICIAYNKDKLKTKEHFKNITPINYTKDVGLVSFRDLIIKAPKQDITPWPEYLIKGHIFLPQTPTTGFPLELVLNTQDFRHAMQKHERWSYEDESRNVVFQDQGERNKAGIALETGNDVIDAIIIGEKATIEDLNKMTSFTRERKIPLFVARANKRTYQVEIDLFSNS
ncbi:DUF2971 domain-containing protein [Vibrio ponticus]|uniref:DUF2971 domain-containing protein n=1 Tax=Vibrio ponticus TaxID=265668 RepID=A0A3N3E097_9VIBR|nr:DUF2971 domain-containing protein [Vibrio ponticus]ROV60175.1 DUF2971 domain-containing protein [Vibrio ponticus]